MIEILFALDLEFCFQGPNTFHINLYTNVCITTNYDFYYVWYKDKKYIVQLST